MNTIRRSLVFPTAAAIAALPHAVLANSIGIDFLGGSAPGDGGTTGGGAVSAMGPGEIAGVVPQANWNDAGIGGQTSKMVNNTGLLDPGTVVNSNGFVVPNLSVGWNAFNTFSTLTLDDPGNDRMMKGYLDTSSPNPLVSSTTSVEFFNLPSVYTTGSYDLYIYYDGLINVGNPPRTGEYQVFDVSNNLVGTVFATDSTPYAGTFIQASGTSVGNATSGNYIEFTDMTSPMITIDATGVAADVPRAPINGIELVALVSEPSSILLLALGCLAIASRYAPFWRCWPIHLRHLRAPGES